ncbi:acyltransferase family protein [Puia dinghuensis]|uniref:Polysaccharide biosynthesis protein n=1 Tax=Puia dinghuensis TaxID=1792502 RepID=A0A8J2UH54_9BACT|nr:acyltransferase family protein [Puia dinghuensis]GGB16317.1 polysaccharide biosynthesis protein [Puia dinghuensis]
MKRNLQHIDEIRFLVIHIVLINHWNINLYLSHAQYDRKIFDIWFDFTSPCLAILSGYLFFYKTKDSFPYFKKLKNRFHSLVVPYLFWCLSFFVVYIVIKDVYVRIFHSTFWYAPEESLSFKNMLSNLRNPTLSNFWYLQNLILILPFNFFIYYLLKNRWVYLAFFLLVLSCYSFNWIDLESYFHSRFLPYYLMGCYFGYNEKYMPRVPISKLGAIILIPVLVWVTLSSSFWKDNVFPFLEIKMCIAMLFLFSVYNLVDSNQNSLAFKYLAKYKPYSFFLFAINMFLFTLIQRGLLKLGAERYLHYEGFLWLFLVGSFLAVIVLAFGIAALLKRYSPKFFYTITGR